MVKELEAAGYSKPEKVDKAMEKSVDQRLKDILDINTNTFNRARDVIGQTVSDAIEASLTPQELTKELKKNLFDMYQLRVNNASTIARTESAVISNGARHTLMDSAGVEYREWLSAHDDKVRDEHAEEDGHIVGMNEVFPVTHLRFPGDPEGKPELVINCRCVELLAKGPEGEE